MTEAAVLIVVEMTAVRDADQLKAYQTAARAQIAERGGIVVARGTSPVEGSPPPGTLLIQKWPSEQAFRDWQDSEAYKPLKALRLQCVDMRIAVVQLVQPL
jgi:uncharacterized protein (DUF1330 family)